MALTLHRFDRVDEFLRRAGAFLGAREAEHNLLWGITSQIRATPELFTGGAPSFAVVTDAGDGVVAATLRTPPHNQVLSEVDDPGAMAILADVMRDEPLPGVLGPTEPAAQFAREWTRGPGRTARIEVRERIFRLDRVTPPARPASGSWRGPAPADRELIADWILAFSQEASPEAEPPPNPLEVADRWIAGVHRRLYLWVDRGRVVSLAGSGGETPNGIRIGPVYTPPEERGHGYASAVTAAASQDQLDRGRRFVFLFTDLANPTSNKIYRAIGYEPVCDVDMYRFFADA